MFRFIAAFALVSVSQALEPFVPPIAVQTAQQASLPNVITINYDVPKKSFLAKIPKADVFYKATLNGVEPEPVSFLKAHGDNFPRPMPVLNVDIPVRGYSAGNVYAKEIGSFGY